MLVLRSTSGSMMLRYLHSSGPHASSGLPWCRWRSLRRWRSYLPISRSSFFAVGSFSFSGFSGDCLEPWISRQYCSTYNFSVFNAQTESKVTYCGFHYFPGFILPVFLSIHSYIVFTVPHKINIVKFEIRMKNYGTESNNGWSWVEYRIPGDRTYVGWSSRWL